MEGAIAPSNPNSPPTVQGFKQNVRKLKNCFTQCDGKHFFQFLFNEKIRIDLVYGMGNGEVYCKFVLTLCVFDFGFQFCIFVFFLKTATTSLFTLGVIKNIILSCFNFCG